MVRTIFRRYELKYLITTEEKQALIAHMAPYMKPDEYGQTIIRNIYYDTPNYRLIRRSIEKPDYKEKIRVRSYAQATAESKVFVELKKKSEHVVYKRRVAMPLAEATAWLAGEYTPPNTQICREIAYARDYYGSLQPRVFLSYRREAYFAKDDGEFRVTFDEEILARSTDLSLTAPPYGTPLCPPGQVLMEIKCAGGMPLWMARFLSANRIYKTSFSKYGTAYQTLIFPHLQISQPKETVQYV